MGIRDSLEEIRFGNVESYDAHAGERRPVRMFVTAFGPSPWMTIWFAPRATIRRVIQSNPTYCVLVLAIVVGLAKSLIRASSNHLGDRFEFGQILLGCLVFGPLMGIITVYLGGFCFQRGARFLGSSCHVDEVQAAIAWGSVPYGIVLFQFVPTLIFLGSDLFTTINLSALTSDFARQDLLLMYVVDLIMLLWGTILTIACLREVTGLPYWKLPGVVVIGAVLFVIFIILPAFVLVFGFQLLLNERSVPTNPLMPTPGVRFLPARNNPLYTAKAQAKEIAAIESQGYKVVVNDGSPDNSLTIDSLELAQVSRVPIGPNPLRNLEIMISVTNLRIKPAKEWDGRGQLLLAEATSIGRMPNLRRLDVSNMGLRDSSFQFFRTLSSLEELKVSHGLLKSPPIGTFTNLPALHTLWLDHNALSDDAYIAVTQTPSLIVLHLESCGLTDAGLANLAKPGSLPNLDELYLGENTKLTAQAISALTNFAALRHLDLSQTKLSDADIPTITTLSTVRTIDLRGTGLTPQGIATLRNEMPGTSILWDKPKTPTAK